MDKGQLYSARLGGEGQVKGSFPDTGVTAGKDRVVGSGSVRLSQVEMSEDIW